MPAPYGVTTTGFSTKTLAEQLAELEVAEQAAFGASVVVDAQSPLGQLNALFADANAEVWEMAQDLYGAFDVDQATGARLDTVAKLRNMTRAVGQSDASFRQVIKADEYANIEARELQQRISAVAGVTSVFVVENNTDDTTATGVPSHSLAIAVIGGTDADVAKAIWDNSVPGIGLVGNTSTQLTIDGLCRTIAFTRPVSVPITVALQVSENLNGCACSPSDVATIQSQLATNLSSDCGVSPGSILTPNDIRQAFTSIDGINVEQVLLARDGGTPLDQSIIIAVGETPVFAANNISVNVVAENAPATTSGSFGVPGFTVGGII